MPTPKIITLSSLLRRSRRTLSNSFRCFSAISHHHHHPNHRHFLRPEFSSAPPPPSPPLRHLAAYSFLSSRSLSTSESSWQSDGDRDITQSDQSTGQFDGGRDITQSDLISDLNLPAAGEIDFGTADESFNPIRSLISLLDGYHDVSGFPWWLVIISSTMAFRFALFPFVVLNLQKVKTIGEFLPKLPPPFPPPNSGKSFRAQFKLFRKESKALGCPSLLWFGAAFAVQVPLFFLWVSTFRAMCLDHHPGFDCGGLFWFQNLTELPDGVLGSIFPVLIGALHYINVQVSFQKSSIAKFSGVFGTLAMSYKAYLELLSLAICYVTFHLPQGSLIYWLTNSSFSLFQQLVLRHPDVRMKLGLPDKAVIPEVHHDKRRQIDVKETNQIGVHGGVSVQNLSPNDLFLLSVKSLTNGNPDRALQLLRLALKKDPEYVRALLLMGQTLLQKNFLDEAIEYFERAISKLLLAGHPTDVEGIDLLILSSTWAGSALIRKGRHKEGLAHLERIASLEEPADLSAKAHYYDGLLMLSSALYAVDRKAEAVEHLRRAAAYDPDRFGRFLEEAENDEDDFVGDLANSRRK